MARVKQRRGQRKISAWSRGEKRNAEGLTLREIGSAQLRLINASRRRMKKCGAKAKSTGEPCRQLPMGNGRCRFHGGKTPSGDNWHVIQPDVSGHKTSMARFDRKLSKAEKARKERRLRLMRATDAERERYERWIWFRPAGSAARRAARSAQARMKRLIAEEKREITAALKVHPPDQETVALEGRLAKLKDLVELVRNPRMGVFG